MTTARVFGIVLAGGASSRFDGDKLAAPYRGRPLLHHALDAVGEVADHVIVVLAPGVAVPPVPAGIVGKTSIARDPAAHRGPLAGLVAGLEAAAAMADGDPRDVALVVGGDMPRLVPAVLRLLVERLERDLGSAAVTLEAPVPAPLPMAVRIGVVGPAGTIVGEGRRSLRALLDIVPAAVIPEREWRPLDPDGRTLADVDTPADLREP